jgi:hypothetical protein
MRRDLACADARGVDATKTLTSLSVFLGSQKHLQKREPRAKGTTSTAPFGPGRRSERKAGGNVVPERTGSAALSGR